MPRYFQRLFAGKADGSGAQACDFYGAAGRVHSDYGTVRFGKDHADEHYRLFGCSDLRYILLDGEEISGMSENRMAEIRNKTLGFVFQHADLLPELTALDNVALPLLYRGVRKKERRARAAEVLEKVGLGDRMEFYPNQMSGGQCQRAAIARAIVGNPKLLLADEPTGALDSQSGKNIMQLFRQLNQEGITIITITHAAEVAQEADKCFHIYDGELFTDREVSAR